MSTGPLIRQFGFIMKLTSSSIVQKVFEFLQALLGFGLGSSI